MHLGFLSCILTPLFIWKAMIICISTSYQEVNMQEEEADAQNQEFETTSAPSSLKILKEDPKDTHIEVEQLINVLDNKVHVDVEQLIMILDDKVLIEVEQSITTLDNEVQIEVVHQMTIFESEV